MPSTTPAERVMFAGKSERTFAQTADAPVDGKAAVCALSTPKCPQVPQAAVDNAAELRVSDRNAARRRVAIGRLATSPLFALFRQTPGVSIDGNADGPPERRPVARSSPMLSCCWC